MVCTGKTEPIEISDSAEILTYTILHTVPEGFLAPIVLGLVEFGSVNENPEQCSIKLLCNGKIPESKISIGQKVKVRQDNDKYYFTELD